MCLRSTWVDTLIARFPDQIPKRDIESADAVKSGTLAAVRDRGAKHLVPQERAIAGIGADEKARQVMLDHPARRLAIVFAPADTRKALVGFDFHDAHSLRSAPSRDRVPVLRIDGHRGDEVKFRLALIEISPRGRPVVGDPYVCYAHPALDPVPLLNDRPLGYQP